MQKEIIEQFHSGRLKLSTWDKIAHYWFIAPILMISFLAWYPEVFGNGGEVEFPIGTILTLVVILFFIYRQYLVLKFKQYAIEHTATQFKEAAIATAMELDWHIEELNEYQLKANRNDLLWNDAGLRITIIRSDNKIFENSIIETTIGSHPFSFGQNTRNLDYFNSNLIDAVKGENVVQKAELAVKAAEDELENEPEWSLKNTIKRVVIYVIMLVLTGASIIVLSERFHIIAILVPLICLAYFVMEIRIMIKKRNKRKS